MAAERLERWLAGFAERHGGARLDEATETLVRYVAGGGATADVEVPFPPLAAGAGTPELVAHCVAARRVGVLLVRLGGHAAGIAEGPRLVTGKVGSRPVHGRSAAGGWSQQRFARRREGQARTALQAAADVAAAVLLPEIGRLEAVVAGGDRASVTAVLSDRRLAPLAERLTSRLLDVPDPRRRVLEEAPALLRRVWIRLREPSA